MFIEVASGVTVCEDTPKNWEDFYRLKELVQMGYSDRLKAQEAKEREYLRRVNGTDWV